MDRLPPKRKQGGIKHKLTLLVKPYIHSSRPAVSSSGALFTQLELRGLQQCDVIPTLLSPSNLYYNLKFLANVCTAQILTIGLFSSRNAFEALLWFLTRGFNRRLPPSAVDHVLLIPEAVCGVRQRPLLVKHYESSYATCIQTQTPNRIQLLILLRQ